MGLSGLRPRMTRANERPPDSPAPNANNRQVRELSFDACSCRAFRMYLSLVPSSRMSISKTDHNLIDQLDELIVLRPFPAAASRLLAACRNENVTTSEISEIISHDPGLAIKLLQTVNSPIYGHSGQISSIQHATVVIGLRALKNLAISTAVGDVFGDGDVVTEETRKGLWSHSLACGSIARTLATVTGRALPDEAFLAGVVHDVGKLFFAEYRPDEYGRILRQHAAESTVEVEIEAFGIAHTSVGVACGRTWGLPDVISDVICFHHQPDESDYSGDLVQVVSTANQLTRIWDTIQTEARCEDTSLLFQEMNVELSPDEISSLKEQAMAELDSIRETHLKS